METLVDANKAARILGLSKQTLYKHFEEGRLPAYKLGKALRFDVDELKEFMRKAARSSVQISEQVESHNENSHPEEAEESR